METYKMQMGHMEVKLLLYVYLSDNVKQQKADHSGDP
jgi:hypothetical protein